MKKNNSPVVKKQQKQIEELLQSAAKASGEKRYAQAETLLRSALALHQSPSTRWRLAVALEAQHKRKEAFEEYKLALTNTPLVGSTLPDNPSNLMKLADLARALGKEDEERQAYYRILEKGRLSIGPGYPVVSTDKKNTNALKASCLAVTGNAIYLRGRSKDAAKLYEQSLKLNPSLYGARYYLGNVLVTTGKVREGLKHFYMLENCPDGIVRKKSREWIARVGDYEDASKGESKRAS